MPHAHYKLFYMCGEVPCGGIHVSGHILILILKKYLLLKMINNNNSAFYLSVSVTNEASSI